MSLLKRSLLLATLLALIPTSAVTANTKLTFDVTIDNQAVVIEAGHKDVNKDTFVTCSYFTPDYSEYLGQFNAADPNLEGEDLATAVREFCVANFESRTDA